jgi:hypothetical protein
MNKEAIGIQKKAALSIKLLMGKERISNKLISSKITELGSDISLQTIMNYSSLRRLPDIGAMITMLKAINDISGNSYTIKDIGLKNGPSFHTYV